MMNPMKTLVMAVLLALLSACSTQTSLIQGGEGRLASSDMQSFFISGLGQTQTIDAAYVCGGADKVAKVERVMSPLNWFLGVLTLGIYTPLDAKVYCTS
jgi:outer membrane biogenesis lipoprotein LolB